MNRLNASLILSALVVLALPSQAQDILTLPSGGSRGAAGPSAATSPNPTQTVRGGGSGTFTGSGTGPAMGARGGGSGTTTIDGVTRNFITDQNGNRVFNEPAPLAVAKVPEGFSVRVTDFSLNRNLEKGDQPARLDIYVGAPNLSPDAIIRRTVVTRAADNLGRDAVGKDIVRVIGGGVAFGPHGGTGPVALSLGRGRGTAPQKDALFGAINLKPASRTVSAFAGVQGRIEIFSPNADSTVTVPDIASKAGKPLADAQLKKHGIEITFITRSNWAAVRNSLGELGTSDEMSVQQNIGLVVRDPQSRFGGFAYQSSDGASLTLNASTGQRSGDNSLYLQQGPLPSGARLVVYLVTPETITSVPFEFDSIPLE